MKKLFVLVLIFGLVGCFPYRVDKPLYNQQESIYTNIISTVHTIKTEYNVIINKLQKKVTRTATSYHIGKGFVVASEHCIYFPTITNSTPWGSVKTPVKSFGYVYYINDEIIDLVGTVDDIALLFDPNLIGTPKIAWANSDKLSVGTPLVLVGNSRMRGVNIKTGIVSILEIETPILEFHGRTAKATFVMTTPVNGGDSGGPVFVFNNGYAYVIGMCYAATRNVQGYNYAIKSNYILDMISEIKNNTKAR